MIKFVTLINDKSVNSLFMIEHGLSFWIEFDDEVYLFDTGQTGNIRYNIDLLKLDPQRINYTILSHSHYDHTGGLLNILDLDIKSKLYIGHGFWNEKYSFVDDIYTRKGNPFYLDDVLKTNMVVEEMDCGIKAISSGSTLVSNVNINTYFQRIDPKFYVRINDQYLNDEFKDEIVLCFEHEKGIVVFVGCSHSGIVNILETIKKQYGKSIYAVVGGFHLIKQENTYIYEVVDYLYKNVEIIGTGHCTGGVAEELLKKLYGNKFFELSVGEYHFI